MTSIGLEEAIILLKKRLTSQGALKNFNLTFGFNELGETLTNPLLRAPQIRATKKGLLIPKAEYTKTIFLGREKIDDAIDVKKLLAILASGATITVDSLELLRNDVNIFCLAMTEAFGIKSTATAYITTPSSSSLKPHTDEEEVLVVQTAGSKYWRYCSASEGNVHSEVIENDTLDGIEPVILRPGDYLCLPSGSPHVAETRELPSIHITFSVEKERYASLIIRAINELRKDSASTLLSLVEPRILDINALNICIDEIHSVIKKDKLFHPPSETLDDSALDFTSLSLLEETENEVIISLLQEIELSPEAEKIILTSKKLPGRLVIPGDASGLLQRLSLEKKVIAKYGLDFLDTKALFILSSFSILKIREAK